MQFIAKHLKDKLYLEGDQRVSLRDMIYREAITNFSLFPKNSTIAKFFKKIGWIDELSSAVRNFCKYNKIYTGAYPIFMEEDVFKTIMPLVSDNNDQASDQVDEEIRKLLKFCTISRKMVEIQEFMNYKHCKLN